MKAKPKKKPKQKMQRKRKFVDFIYAKIEKVKGMRHCIQDESGHWHTGPQMTYAKSSKSKEELIEMRHELVFISRFHF